MNIGLLGFGVVGGGVLELTQSRSDIAVSRVLLRSPKAGLPEGLATYDFNDILTDDAIDTVVEVMGGTPPTSTSAPLWSGARTWSRPTRP